MGQLTETVKQALGEDWEARIADQTKRLQQHIPTSDQLAKQKAIAMLKEWNEKVKSLGYALRASRDDHKSLLDIPSGVLGRELTTSFPLQKASEKKAFLGDAIANSLIELGEDTKLRLARKLDEIKTRGMATTERPGSLPWFYPAMAHTLPSSLASGYEQAETEIDARRAKEVDDELAAAQTDFEQALSDEFAASRKTASVKPSELIDAIAQIHVKQAAGELNEALGMYLAMADLLGRGAHEASKRWFEARDPRRQKYEAMRSAIKQRMIKKPAPVQFLPEGELADAG